MDIDFVVLWVDGNDPRWQAEKRKYSGAAEDDSNAAHRFRDWDLMRYWFRALENYAPWFRKIHFVTWGHLPAFLDESNPRLHIVRHEDYMPREALPTFSSHPLEMNLFRIEGLADHFVYFNDDTFLGRPMGPEKFFDEKNGLPKAQFCELPNWLYGELNAYEIAKVRSLGMINKHFPKRDFSWGDFWKKHVSSQYPLADNVRNVMMKLLFSGYYTGIRAFHMPVAYLKSTFETIWERERDLLWRTTLHRFRSTDDVNQLIAFYWQLASGQFMPGKIDGEMVNVGDGNIGDVCALIEQQKRDMFCLNDPSPDIDFEALKARLTASFQKILPDPCSFER